MGEIYNANSYKNIDKNRGPLFHRVIQIWNIENFEKNLNCWNSFKLISVE